MYRSSFVALSCLALLTCCDSKEATPAPPPSRYEAVTVKQTVSTDDLKGFCDVQNDRLLSLPEAQDLPKVSPGPRWINVWATWCKSCVEEMPMIEEWRKNEGFSVTYISADEDAGALDAFKKAHPELPRSAVMVDPEGVSGWMTSLGLDEGAGLPLHLFVSKDGKIRCARAAAVSEHHLPIIRALLR